MLVAAQEPLGTRKYVEVTAQGPRMGRAHTVLAVQESHPARDRTVFTVQEPPMAREHAVSTAQDRLRPAHTAQKNLCLQESADRDVSAVFEETFALM